jgi:hypothetical protein
VDNVGAGATIPDALEEDHHGQALMVGPQIGNFH